MQSAFEGILTAWRPADDVPVLDRHFHTAGRGGSLLDFFHGTDNLDGRFDSQVERIDRLDAVARHDALYVAGTVTENNKVGVLLGTETVHPAVKADLLADRLGHGCQFDLLY